MRWMWCLALVGVMAAAETVAAQDVRVRKHVDDMTAAEWQTLAAAIKELRSADKIDVHGSGPYPQSHDSYEWFVHIHGMQSEGGACRHRSEEIWPWHRAFLLHFETRLRATSVPGAAAITLPYWDWSEVPSGQHGFPAEYERLDSEFYSQRKTWPAGRTPLDLWNDRTTPLKTSAAEFVAGILADDDWADFGGGKKSTSENVSGTLERLLHNTIHSYIGGVNEKGFRAVRDPLFWAHHANLDRLWDEWQRLHPTAIRCIDCSVPIYDRSTEFGPLIIADLVDNAALPKGIRVVYQSHSTGNPLVQPQPLSTLGRTTDRAPFRVVVPATVSGTRIVVKLAGVRVPNAESYTTAVYLFPADVPFSTSADFARSYGAGSYATFPLGHDENLDPAHAGHAPQTFTALIDVTDAFNRVPAAMKDKPWLLCVRVIPAAANAAENTPDISFDSIFLLQRDGFSTRPIPLRLP